MQRGNLLRAGAGDAVSVAALPGGGSAAARRDDRAHPDGGSPGSGSNARNCGARGRGKPRAGTRGHAGTGGNPAAGDSCPGGAPRARAVHRLSQRLSRPGPCGAGGGMALSCGKRREIKLLHHQRLGKRRGQRRTGPRRPAGLLDSRRGRGISDYPYGGGRGHDFRLQLHFGGRRPGGRTHRAESVLFRGRRTDLYRRGFRRRFAPCLPHDGGMERRNFCPGGTRRRPVYAEGARGGRGGDAAHSGGLHGRNRRKTDPGKGDSLRRSSAGNSPSMGKGFLRPQKRLLAPGSDRRGGNSAGL